MKPTLKSMLETEADLQRSHAPVRLARFPRCGMRAAGILEQFPVVGVSGGFKAKSICRQVKGPNTE